MQVLVAEDSSTTRHVVRDAVERLGYACAEATNGTAAWEWLQRHEADVVISDWLMPGGDGLELCQRLRAQERPGYTYFIFLTTLDDRPHVLAGMAASADDYLPKPLDHDDLRLRLAVAERVTTLHRERAAAQFELGRLQGVHLAARTLQHELGNKLARTAGYVQLLSHHAALTADDGLAARRALDGVQEAVRIVNRLQTLVDLEHTDWGPNLPPTIHVPAGD
jgi:DNA-binding response OmpR family regulator